MSIKKSSIIYFFSAIPVLLGGCAYRLTNLHIASPNNISTIHISAVYDTSADAAPHELLWDELQRAIAANGHLKLTSEASADALMRVHIISTDLYKTGDLHRPEGGDHKKEPDIFFGPVPQVNEGDIRRNLRNIVVADNYFMKTGWSSAVRCEVWDLKTQKLILQRDYPMSGEMLSARADIPAQMQHLRQEESYNASFGNAARGVAERIVTDLLVH